MAGHYAWTVLLISNEMIDIQTKIHDKFAIEFKVGFSGREDVKDEHFDVNTWIFIPNGLDINKNTYSKDRFYTDMKSNVRLITPSFTLKDMVGEQSVPFRNLKKAVNDEMASDTPEHRSEFEFQLKLFGSIFKSSIRDAATAISKNLSDTSTFEQCKTFTGELRRVLTDFRGLKDQMNGLSQELLSKYAFADEYMSHQVEIRSLRIIRAIDQRKDLNLDLARKELEQLFVEEETYKIKQGYSHAVIDDEKNNRQLVYRHSLLKKYIESALFLKVNTTQDGKAVKQISFSLAAGLAMMVSMLVTLPFQKYLGNYPYLIFIILILIYMLKDRIKELTRWLFAYQLKDKYYDNKTVVNIKDKKVGWIKEGMDFITDDKVPAEVMTLRGRSTLESDNAFLEEKIILYRKKVEIDQDLLKNHYNYDFKGINDIMRYHINFLTKKMDNPESLVHCLDEEHRVHTLKADRVYTLFFVLQFKWAEQVEYKSFRVVVNRNGILEINPR